ncbi:hypothetical protein DPSP01_000346 [Paraphaeosphaeria sporulosa]
MFCSPRADGVRSLLQSTPRSGVCCVEHRTVGRFGACSPPDIVVHKRNAVALTLRRVAHIGRPPGSAPFKDVHSSRQRRMHRNPCMCTESPQRLGLHLSPAIVPALMRLLPLSKDLLHFELSTETLVRRCQQQLDYTGILNEWPTAEEKGVLDREDLELNAPLLIGAGSETTATTMSGAT